MRIKYLWYAIVAFFSILGFFGNWSRPKNLADAMNALAEMEQWWSTHTAHPTLAAFFVGLSVSTVLLPEGWRAFWNHLRPQLDIKFDPESIHECSLNEGKGWIQFRMMVQNQRTRKTVHNCEGRVARVESQILTRPFVERVPLTWAFKNDLNQTDLQDGQALPLNVIILRQYANGQSTAQFISTSDANNPIHPFNLKGEYQCTIVVSSEETRPLYVDFIFDWTSDFRKISPKIELALRVKAQKVNVLGPSFRDTMSASHALSFTCGRALSSTNPLEIKPHWPAGIFRIT